jgi:hypothetical protein
VKASDNMQKGRVLRLKSFGILEFLQKSGEEIYPLSIEACEFYK